MSTTRTIHGAAIETLTSKECQCWIDWLRGEGSGPGLAQNVMFALAHCDSGVTWAFLDARRAWCLGSSFDPDLCPVPSVAHLQELRFVGAQSEVLIWKGGDGLVGRILSDRSDELAPHLQPWDESRHLLGNPKRNVGDFILYVDGGGAQHMAPYTFPKEFLVRHYFEEDQDTGAVRVAASRWVVKR